MFIDMYLSFNFSSAQSRSLYFSLLLSLYLSLSLGMSFISQRSLVFPLFGYCYCSVYLCDTIFDTLFWIFFKLFILVSIFLDMCVSIFLIFSDTIILSIFAFGCFYFSRFFYLRLPLNCFIASLSLLMPLSLSFDASPTVSAHVPLSYLYYLFQSFALSLFYFPYSNFFVIVSPYLPLSLTSSLFGTTSNYTSLYLCDIIPLLFPFPLRT